MRIDFVRSGGFAGMRLSCSVDTETLPADHAARIERLVDKSGFFGLPEQVRASGALPDRFQYRIQISSDVYGTHVVQIGEPDVPEPLAPLLDFLNDLALKTKRPEGDG